MGLIAPSPLLFALDDWPTSKLYDLQAFAWLQCNTKPVPHWESHSDAELV